MQDKIPNVIDLSHKDNYHDLPFLDMIHHVCQGFCVYMQMTKETDKKKFNEYFIGCFASFTPEAVVLYLS